jgi:hypothetical protein
LSGVQAAVQKIEELQNPGIRTLRWHVKYLSVIYVVPDGGGFDEKNFFLLTGN